MNAYLYCKYNIFEGMDLEFLKGKYGLQFILLLFILLASTIIFGLLSLSFISFYEGTDMETLSKEMENGGNSISLVSRYSLIVLNQVGTFLLPSLIFAGLFKVSRIDYLNLYFKLKPKFWGLILPLAASCIIIVGFLAEINALYPASQSVVDLENEANKVTNEILGNDSISLLFLNILVLGLLPAMAEEFLFRGVIQKLFIGWTQKPWLGVLLTAFLFSFIHFQFLTFLPRFFMGIVLGYLFLWSRSLIVPILAHFIYNSLNIVAFYFLNDAANQENETNYFLLSIAIILFSGIAYWLSKNNKNS